MNVKKFKQYLGFSFDALIILDLIFIIISLPIRGIHLIDYAGFVKYYDLTICALIFIEFFYGFYQSETKVKFTKKHFLDLIASIPFDLVAPLLLGSGFKLLNVTRFLRLVRLARVFRAINIVKKYGLEKVIKHTGIDKILIGVGVIIVIFTLLLSFLANETISNSLYFVLITLTTVGYGSDGFDEPLAKFVTVFLIIFGVLVFSTITGVISSFFTDKLLEEGISVDENLHFINQKLNFNERELERTRNELTDLKEKLEKSNEYSKELKEQVSELKDLLNSVNEKT